MVAPLVLVVGMHRSGTSLLGSILCRLGLCFPGNAIPADVHNPQGYYEWKDIVLIQERLLVDLDRWWPSDNGRHPLPQGWLSHPATLKAEAKLHSLLLSESLTQNSAWCIKDPRCSRLLPLWCKLAEELNIPLHIVLAIRDPSEVVTSLVHRDGPTTGMSSERAQVLWWRHNIEVLNTVNDFNLPVSIINYSDWFINPRQQLESLLQSLPFLAASEASINNSLSLINPNYRRSIPKSPVGNLHPSVKRLFTVLSRNLAFEQSLISLSPFFLKFLLKSLLYKSKNSPPSPESWPSWLKAHSSFPAPSYCYPINLQSHICISVCGPSWLDIDSHVLLNYLPLPTLTSYSIDTNTSSPHQLHLNHCVPGPTSSRSAKSISLNLELPGLDRASHWINHLSTQDLIFDPEPTRVLLLRALGLPAWWIDPHSPSNGWLDQPCATSNLNWSSKLGLAPPIVDSLVVLGSAGRLFDSFLSKEESSSSQFNPPIHYVPGWNLLSVNDIQSSLALAGWIKSAAITSSRLFFTQDTCLDSCLRYLSCCSNTPLSISNSLSTTDIRQLHHGKPIMAPYEDRDSPGISFLYSWSSDCAPDVSVLVSLYNYHSFIISALESVRSQEGVVIELIVVDDCSVDGGESLVHSWMEHNSSVQSSPFCSLKLIQHDSNTGLAAARNTAFHHASSDWCFVLDADNIIFKYALKSCLELVDPSDPLLSVVHPLISVDADIDRSDDVRSLIGPHTLQRLSLLNGNVVDAMALIRRSSWKHVGGYTHIDGGWEDFDFWCKLFESNFHAIQCPRILASYRSHSNSMTHLSSSRRIYSLSLTLQHRHPWLTLPDVLS